MRGRVYFLRVSRYIKIGHTVNVKQRYHMLKTGCPLKVALVGSFPGTPGTERRLHKLFAALKVRREWFKASPELLAFITDNSKPLRKRRTA